MANDAALEQAIAALLEERAEIDQTIAALQRRLGRTAVAAGAPAGAGANLSASAGGEIVAHPGEFHQHSLTAAAEKILRRAGRPVKTQEILAALQRAEFQTGAKNPAQSIYTGLARHKGFLKVRPNTWALAEWFPNAGGKNTEPPEPKKRRRRSRKVAVGPKLSATGRTTEKAEDQQELLKTG